MASSPDVDALRRDAQAWARDAAASGWISAQQAARFAELEHESPESLFEDTSQRPLVVAFFGGTGVGKSTLLNRLAGQEIARTGVVRPTSREISIYVHQSVRLKPLPPHLPVERVQMVLHQSDVFREVLWVDMPDFDSTDKTNHELALGWLPHIDVLIYVVNPERYRDDRGWRMLKQHERDHAWLFVMNQADRGHPAQLDDFRKLLNAAGFDDPLIFRTACPGEGRTVSPDDFPLIAETIAELSQQRVMTQLTLRTLEARRRSITDLLEAAVAPLADTNGFQKLSASWEDIWRETSSKLRKGLVWPINALVSQFVNGASPLLTRGSALRETAADSAADPTSAVPQNALWDDWADLCLDDALERLMMQADRDHLPSIALRSELAPVRQRAARWVLDKTQTALRTALAEPGQRWQRWLRKFTAVLSVLSPLAAILWVSYEVVVTYYHSVEIQGHFLGSEFAIHSGLLILVAWLLPYFVHQKLKPTAEQTARRGIQKGLSDGLEAINSQVLQGLDDWAARAAALHADARRLITQSHSLQGPSGSAPDQGSLRRTLATERR